MSPGIDYVALAEFRHQIRRFLNFSEEQARLAGLNPQQHQLLLALQGLPEGVRPTIRTLAERLQLRHHTVVGLIDRMAGHRLVSRQRGLEDAREIHIAITPTGARLLRGLSLAHTDELRRAAPALTKALRAVLRGDGQKKQSRTRSCR